MNWSSQLDCNIPEVRIRKEICLGLTSKDWKMVCNVLVFSSEHEKSLSGWKYDSTCEWLIHSKGNVRYSVQPINIEQRGKPRYLGMHVIEKWKTRQTIWCPPNKTLARRYKLPFDRFFLTWTWLYAAQERRPRPDIAHLPLPFFLGPLPFRHCPLCLLNTDRLFAAHQRRHEPDIAHWPRIRR